MSEWRSKIQRHMYVDAYHRRPVAAGAELVKPLRDEPWGMREFGVRTVDGHRIMFGSERGGAS